MLINKGVVKKLRAHATVLEFIVGKLATKEVIMY